jgi:hypothetical protein
MKSLLEAYLTMSDGFIFSAVMGFPSRVSWNGVRNSRVSLVFSCLDIVLDFPGFSR